VIKPLGSTISIRMLLRLKLAEIGVRVTGSRTKAKKEDKRIH